MKTETALRRPPAGTAPLDLTSFLSYRMMRLHSALNAQATALLAESGLTLGQWRIIAISGGGLAQTSRDFAQFFGLDPAFVSRTLKSLEECGLMTSTRGSADRRVLSVALTEEGRVLYKRVLPRMQRRQQALMDALDPEEQRMVHAILNKLEHAAENREFPA